MTEFMTTQGLTSIQDFVGLKSLDISKLVKAHNGASPHSGLIGLMFQKKLEILAFWVNDHSCCQLTLDAVNWDEATLQHAKIEADVDAENKANKQAPEKPGTIVTGLGWYLCIEKFENYLSSVYSVGGVPHLYVVYRDKPAGRDLETIYQVALNDPKYEADNKTVYKIILEATLDQLAHEWIHHL